MLCAATDCDQPASIPPEGYWAPPAPLCSEHRDIYLEATITPERADGLRHLPRERIAVEDMPPEYGLSRSEHEREQDLLDEWWRTGRVPEELIG